MARNILRIFVFVFFSVLLVPTPTFGQQAAAPIKEAGCPSGQPGVYVQDAAGWHLLAQASPSKMKAKHGILSSISYGAVAAPMVVEYPGDHAQVQVRAARPLICVSHIMFPSAPLLVRLHEKKKIRELDSGTIRAVPFTDSSRQGHASASSLVVTTTMPSENGTTLFQPQADLTSGEYAVMFGAQNLAILDFGVSATP
jgi:hypothetical protein